MIEEAVEIRVSGRVQGVGFRWFTCNAAEEYGIRGWVRNEPDGSVLIQACGPHSQMALFRRKLEQGPRFGRVDHLVEAPLDEQTALGFSGFYTIH